MSNSGSSEQFAQELLLDLIRKIDAVADRVDHKIDSLDQKLEASHRDIRDGLVQRVEPLERKVEDMSLKLNRHEHNFTILGFLVTGGFATLTGAFNWIGTLFGHK